MLSSKGRPSAAVTAAGASPSKLKESGKAGVEDGAAAAAAPKDSKAAEKERESMRDFWREHSQTASVQEMMLDSKAAEIDAQERPEVRFFGRRRRGGGGERQSERGRIDLSLSPFDLIFFLPALFLSTTSTSTKRRLFFFLASLAVAGAERVCLFPLWSLRRITRPSRSRKEDKGNDLELESAFFCGLALLFFFLFSIALVFFLVFLFSTSSSSSPISPDDGDQRKRREQKHSSFPHN